MQAYPQVYYPYHVQQPPMMSPYLANPYASLIGSYPAAYRPVQTVPYQAPPYYPSLPEGAKPDEFDEIFPYLTGRQHDPLHREFEGQIFGYDRFGKPVFKPISPYDDKPAATPADPKAATPTTGDASEAKGFSLAQEAAAQQALLTQG